MAERDRLINELKKAKNRCLIHESGGCLACKYRGQADCTLENLADHLLANGVIVPPCKVGDVVYEFGCTDPFGDQADLYVVKSTMSGIAIFTTEDIHNMNCVGKTIFLTKEEAEEKLKELGK